MAQLRSCCWILPEKPPWRQENWLRISGVSFETKAEKEKIFGTKITFKRIHLERELQPEHEAEAEGGFCIPVRMAARERSQH